MFEFGNADRAVALTPDLSPRAMRKVVDKAGDRTRRQGVVLLLNTEQRLPSKLIEAAAEVSADRDDVRLSVGGWAVDFSPDDLAPFSRVRHLNLVTYHLAGYDFLAAFSELRSLAIHHPTKMLDLDLLSAMSELTKLSIPAGVRSEAALKSLTSLTLLHCASNAKIFSALADHPALQYLDVSFGTNRDLSALPEVLQLRGVSLYQVRGLTGDDLGPLAGCTGLTALSLGALRNVTHLSALAGGPSNSLRALLLERLTNIASLRDVAVCSALTQLGLYESRPTDKSLTPLRDLNSLTHLALDDVYPKSEIDNLLTWYSGALHYRDRIDRGEFKPTWRTPIERLAE